MPSVIRNLAGGKSIADLKAPRSRRGDTNQIVDYWFGGITETAGAYESIATYVVGSGGQTDITFSSIPQTYKHLQLRYMTKSSGGYYSASIQVNGDTGSNYSWHYLDTNGISVTSGASTSTTSMVQGVIPPDYFGVAVVDFLDYTDTNKFKTIKTLYGLATASAGYCDLYSGNWRSTSAITSIKIVSANAQYSHFALYGIKG